MHAVIKALEGAKAVFIHDHLGHCLEGIVKLAASWVA
jgi:DNA-binding FrmR family transcriptional regulator